MTYKFIGQEPTDFFDDNNYDSKMFMIFQICVFPDKNNKYFVRKLEYVNDNIREFIYMLNKYQLQSLMDNIPENQYKTYNINNLKNLQYPSNHDILVAKSSIMGDHITFGNYASCY